MTMLLTLLTARLRRDENGFVTAEHLGVAALAVAALVVIFGAIQLLGADIIQFIRDELGI